MDPFPSERYGGYTQEQVQQGQTTEYLGDVRPGGLQVSLPTAPQPMQDTVSYWDGDGVGGSPAITIDLSDQKAYFYKSGKLVGVSRISSGDAKHATPTGSFKISQKSKDHASNLYGDYIDRNGNILQREVDFRKDPKPPGGIVDGAKMPYFMRFNGGVGMHAGYLPGYAASHGCVRMPEPMARAFFNNVSSGTPVKVQP